jgi:predicted AAA+ superfamily ATPase
MIDDIFELSRQFLKNYHRPYKRYFHHKHPLENRFSIIIGPRGTGKTTVIIQNILSTFKNDFYTRKALYIPADHFIMVGKSLYEIAEEFYNYGGECICFDEIHKWPNWSGELKSIYDSFPKLRIIASGSSAILIQKGSHDLSRRAVVYHMTGLSFREYLDLLHGQNSAPLSLETILEYHEECAAEIIKSVESEGAKVLSVFKDYLVSGYFPYFHEFKNESLYHIILEQGLHTTIESDLISVYPKLSGRSIQKIKKLLSFIAESVPFTPDLKRIKKIVEIGDERTLKNYLKYLEDGGAIITLSKGAGGLRELEKPEKIYLNNTNLIYAISGKGKENIGNIRETFFISMLSGMHKMSISKVGDFFVDDKYIFEIGGRNKGFRQIKDAPDSFLAIDDVEIGIGKKIPLWLFGFLY